ncbi:hypothetical protein D3C80_654530 [compost metagenome]
MLMLISSVKFYMGWAMARKTALMAPLGRQALSNDNASFYPKKSMPSRKTQKVIVAQLF